MSYFINLVEAKKCVFLTYEGDMSVVEATAALEEIAELLVARRWKRVVVDVTTMQSVPKAAELFASGRALSQGSPLSARIGLVVRLDQAKHVRLIEMVARNGRVFLTYFTDAEKAEAWVQGDPSRHGTFRNCPHRGHPCAKPTKVETRGNHDS